MWSAVVVIRASRVTNEPRYEKRILILHTNNKGQDIYSNHRGYLCYNFRNNTFWHVCWVKIKISLCIHIVWSESSRGIFWIAKDT